MTDEERQQRLDATLKADLEERLHDTPVSEVSLAQFAGGQPGSWFPENRESDFVADAESRLIHMRNGTGIIL